MATEYSVELTFGYSNTDFKRTYKINDVNPDAISNVKSKVIAYNANIPAADKKVFISDDYDDTDSENIIGEFSGITAAKAIEVIETKIV